MPKKQTEVNPGQLGFGDDIENLPPLPPEPGTVRLPGKDGLVDVPYSENGVSVRVEDYARGILQATIKLDSSARPRGMKKAVETIPGKHKELKTKYAQKTGAEHAFDFIIKPGSDKKLSEKTKTADELFNEAFGDLELAKQKAFEQFTPEERAEIELSDQYRLDQDIERARFKNKMTSSKKVPLGKRKPENWPTAGLLARRAEQEKMSGHLKRIHDAKNSDQAAA